MSQTMAPARIHPAPRRFARSLASVTALVMAVSSLALLAPSAHAAADDPPTVVSLTFDDGNADQMAAAEIMKSRGMPGTFYVNSGTIGMSGFLTRAQLDALAADGNEIGGHTLNHTDLTTLPAEEARRQICLDRANLIDWGFAPRSFAYPFAMLSATARQLVQDCGYNSARGLGDIESRFGCAGCDPAEAFVPASPYETKALDQVDNTWTLQDFQDAVTKAEQSGGGWVQFTFHNFCGAVCGELSVSESIFTDFLDWLQQRKASNNTSVETVGTVIGGTVKPAVATPDPVPTNDPSGLTNPGFETVNDTNLPICWQQGGFGTNTAAFSTVTPGRTGNRAAQVTVTGYVDGDAKLLPSLDLGTCAPPASPGRSYVLRSWYTSTASTQYAVYLRTTAGGWVYWTSSPYFAAASSYTQAAWTTPEIPAGYTGISFGLSLFSDGTLTTDDYSISAADAKPVTSATVTPAAADGAAGWYITRPSVALTLETGSEAAVRQYSFDGTTWTDYTAPIAIPDGAQNLMYRSRTSDTIIEDAHTLPLKVDTVVPTVQPTFSKASRIVDATVTDVSSGPGTIEVREGAGAWTPFTGPRTMGPAGTTLEFRATDIAGNPSAVVPLTVTPAIGTAATISPPAPEGLDGWYTSLPTVALTLETGDPAAVRQYSFDGTTWIDYLAPVGIPQGTSTFYYRAVGADETETAHTIPFKVDTEAPTVTPTFDKATRIVDATAADATSAIRSIEHRIDGGAWATHSGPITVGDNASTIEFRATDNAGHVSALKTVDVPAALITSAAVSPTAPDGLAGWYMTKPQITLTKVSGAASAITQYSIDGGDWTTNAGPFQLDDGTPTLRYRTVNGDDVEATQTRSFKIDTAAPTVTTTFTKGTRTVEASASDGGSGLDSLERRINGGAWGTYSAPIALGDNASSIEFRATDKAGNVSPVKTVGVPAALITSATVAPDAPDGPTGWYVTKPQITLVKVSGAEGAIQQYSIDGGEWRTYSGPFELGDGTQTIRYRTVDGDDVEDVHERGFQVDTTGPVVEPKFDKAARSISVTARDDTSGVVRIERRIAGGEWEAYTEAWTATDAATSVQFRAFDEAGNVSSTETLAVPERHASSNLRLALGTSSTTYGKTVRATVAVSVPAGEPAATGAVTVRVDGAPVGSTSLVNGSGTVALPSTLSVRTHQVTASYEGDATTKPSTSDSASLTIKKATPRVSFTLSSSRARVGTTRIKIKPVISVPGTSVRTAGRVYVLVDGKIVSRATLRSSSNGKLTITLPKFKNRMSGKKVKISLKFAGSSTLKAVTTKKKTLRIVP